MNCPYCGRPKAKPLSKGSNVYRCSFCEYRFEPSFVLILLDRYFSFPFASVVFTGIIVTVNCLFTYLMLPNGKSYLSFLNLNLLMTTIILILVYFTTTERKMKVLAIKRLPLKERIKHISILLKAVLYLAIIMLVLFALS